MTLLFGCQRPDEDHLYREEMLEMVQKGVLHEVHTAYSRLPGQPKVNAAIACAVGRAFKAQTMVGALAPHMPLTCLRQLYNCLSRAVKLILLSSRRRDRP